MIVISTFGDDTYFDLFVIGSYNSGYDNVADQSDFSTALLLRRRIFVQSRSVCYHTRAIYFVLYEAILFRF